MSDYNTYTGVSNKPYLGAGDDLLGLLPHRSEGAHRADPDMFGVVHDLAARRASGFSTRYAAYCREYPHRGGKHRAFMVSWATARRDEIAFNELAEQERDRPLEIRATWPEAWQEKLALTVMLEGPLHNVVPVRLGHTEDLWGRAL